MPAEIAIFRDLGMALMMYSRTGRMLSTRKMAPEMNTAPNATCHE